MARRRRFRTGPPHDRRGGKPSGPVSAGRTERVRLPSARVGSMLLVAAILLTGCRAHDTFVAVAADIEPPPTTAGAPTAAPVTTASPVATAAPTAPPPAARPGLVPYSAGWFTISLPGPGEVDRQTVPSAVGPIELTIVSVITSTSGYGVAYNVAPLSSIDLDGAARGAAAGVRGKLTEVKPITYKGRPARDFRVVGAQGGVATVFGRVIDVNQRALQIQAVFKGGNLNAPPDGVYSQVLASLRF